MIYNLLGFALLEGTSKKTNKPYSFYDLHCSYTSPFQNHQGLAVERIQLQKGFLKDIDLLACVGKPVNIDFDSSGRAINFHLK